MEPGLETWARRTQAAAWVCSQPSALWLRGQGPTTTFARGHIMFLGSAADVCYLLPSQEYDSVRVTG